MTQIHTPTVQFRFVDWADRTLTPEYKSAGAAGIDLHVQFDDPKTAAWMLRPAECAHLPTGLSVAIPRGFEGQIRLRSSWADCGLIIPNAPGTIDSDYRGEIKIIVINIYNRDLVINRGDRIAQMIIAPVARANFVAVDALPKTERGEGGFGSTGGAP